MRLITCLLLASLPAGCGGSGQNPTGPGPVDGGAPAPDLSPTCLPVEPAPPMLDPNCPIQKPAQPDALDDALKVVGLDRCTLKLSTAGYAGARDPYRLPWYDTAHDYAVNGPSFARTLVARLDAAGADTKKLLSKTWDESALVTGAVRLAAAVERAGLARFAGRTGFSFDQGTPLGRVVVRDAANDMYPDDDSDAIAVLVDTGGD